MREIKFESKWLWFKAYAFQKIEYEIYNEMEYLTATV